MLKTIILHIGMYHTGTTALQNVLMRNPPELTANGIYFQMCMPLTYALHREINPHIPRQSPLDAETLFTQAVRAAHTAGAHTLVLSHEGITYNPYYRSLTYRLNESLAQCRRNADHIRRRLRDLTRTIDVRIVFYPRRQDHWINSNFCNAVYMNDMCGITHEAIELYANDCLQYHTLVKKWAASFGHESVCVRPYEKAQMPKGTLYDFCTHILHCPVPPDGTHEKAYTANVTPGRDIIRLYERFNPYFEHTLLNKIVANVNNDDNAALLLPYNKRRCILDKYSAENRKLAQAFLQRDALFFEEEPQENRFPAGAEDIPATRRPRLAAHVKHVLVKEHWHVDDGLIFHALSLPQPSVAPESAPALLHPENEAPTQPDLYVRIPRDNTPERVYALQMFLCEWLGLCVQVVVADVQGYHLCDAEDKCLLYIADTLFADKADGQWLHKNCLPQSVDWLTHEGKNVPVFYGTPVMQERDGALFCGADLFGMTFFMLTRFEECLIRHRDKFLRVPAKEHFVVRHGLAHLPLVDIWAHYFAQLLRSMGVPVRPRGTFALHLTHDLDWFETDDSLFWLARTGHEAGHAGTFNLMGMPTHRDDGNFALDAPESRLSILRTIVKDFGHTLGFHPGMDSWINRLVWRAQYESLAPLREALDQPMKGGRQHYLRYALPFTWRLWEENGMDCDMGVGYPEMLGFRCGTGQRFKVFDALARRPMRLYEQPLIVMDATINYLNISLPEFYTQMEGIRQTAHKYSTPITVLFHNTSFAHWHTDCMERRTLYKEWLRKW